MDAAAVLAITGAADFATIITGIGAMGAALGLLYVSVKGAKALIGFLRG